MYAVRLSKAAIQGKTFIGLMIILVLWMAGQTTSQVSASSYQASLAPVVEAAAESEAAISPASPIIEEAAEPSGWFVVDEESAWSEEELLVVQQIMDRTWTALETAGLDGASLLEGYRFRREPAEFVPGDGRLLAYADHQRMEIVLADGAFERLHGFYIYHEVGHAVDRQLERQPSEAYHRIAGEGQPEATEESDAWETVTGFWLRTAGRDDREEATADAFAWWVMAQSDQPQPFFPGTPATTDYDEIAGTMEEALKEITGANN